jgi:crotonobetainyl-CoA:carnitine CoA-transferase CaiB-like acyl-CoA transferase
MSEPFQPLAGVTVLAWEQAVSLPMATRLLADLGATVIRVDAQGRAAPRPRYLGNDLVRNKLSLALDLRNERGREVFRALVRRVDVVCENYTPRVKRQFGLTYADLVRERPDLIMLSLSGYGQTGKWSERPTYGPGIEAAAGQARSMGFPDLPPTRPGTVVYADNISGYYAAFAILAALHHRRATGRGRYIDLSMYEANAFHLSLSIARSSRTGRPEERRGNAEAAAALQDVYPARDEGRWLAVTVPASRLDALRTVTGAAAGAEDRALRDWAAGRTAEAGAAALQAAGIAASPVQDARDVLLDPQLRHREAFTPVEHDAPLNGYPAHPHGASPWRFEGHPRPPLREAPAAGQDSRAVLSRLLELDEAAIDALIADGAVGEPATPPPATVRRQPAAQLAKLLEWKLIAAVDPEPEATLGLAPRDEVHHAARA